MNNIQLMEFLISTSDMLERRLDRRLAFLRGISYREYRLLKCIEESPQRKMTRVDLATAVGLTPSAVTRALKPLEKLGYITTERGVRDAAADRAACRCTVRDARQNLAVLTEGGVSLLNDTTRAVTDMVAQLPVSDWSSKQKSELGELLSALRGQA